MAVSSAFSPGTVARTLPRAELAGAKHEELTGGWTRSTSYRENNQQPVSAFPPVIRIDVQIHSSDRFVPLVHFQ